MTALIRYNGATASNDPGNALHRLCLTGGKTLQNPTETGPEPDKTLQKTVLKTEVFDGADAGGKTSHPRPSSLERSNKLNEYNVLWSLSGRSPVSTVRPFPPFVALRNFQRSFFCPIPTPNCAIATTGQGPVVSRQAPEKVPGQTKSCVRRFKSRYRPRRSAMGGVLANLVRAGRQQPQRDLLRVVVRSPPHPHFRRPAPAHCPFSDGDG